MTAALPPAAIRRRLRQTGALARLADLRRDVARRELSSARAALVEAAEARDHALRQSDALAAEQAARREALRSPMLGRAQLRGAMESVLTTFAADREREAQARQAVAAAELMLDAARQDVETARQGLAAAERLIDKRQRMRAPLLDARDRARERADELEAADFRPGAALVRRAAP